MSDAVLAALLALASAGAPSGEATALLARAERVRTAFPEGVLTIRVTSTAPGQSAKSGMFEVAVKGRDRSRLKFLDAEDRGRVVVSVGNESWLLLPTTKNPVRVPASHRIRGGLAVADVARTSFADDYEAVVEREDDVDGRHCSVLRLTAKKGASASYPVIRVWVDEKEGLYRKAIFLVASGRTAKETTFDAYETR